MVKKHCIRKRLFKYCLIPSKYIDTIKIYILCDDIKVEESIFLVNRMRRYCINSLNQGTVNINNLD